MADQNDVRSDRMTLGHVLLEEVKLLRGAFPTKVSTGGPARSPEAADVYRAIAAFPDEERLSALCLSGGGIRSATFNLGVLQALARAGILGSFDYLSTVSGGGYIGTWLQAWMRRERDRRRPDGTTTTSAQAREAVLSELAATMASEPLRPEPVPIDRLREFSNYLTPRTGIFSGDTWAVVAIVVRNLLLNWLVIVPVLAVAVVIPQGTFLFAGARDLGSVSWAKSLSWVALALGLLSSVLTHLMRARERGIAPEADPERRWEQRGREKASGKRLSISSVVLFYAAATLFVLSAFWAERPWYVVPGLGVVPRADDSFQVRMLRAAVWTIGLPLLGAVIGRTLRRQRPRWSDGAAEIAAFVSSGFLAAALIAWLMGAPWRALLGCPALLTILALPALLVVYALSRALFTGVRSLSDDFGMRDPAYGEADREWWARITGRALLGAGVWACGSALVMLGVWTLGHGGEALTQLRHWVGAGVAAAGGAAAVVSALLGKSPDTSPGFEKNAVASRRKELLLRAACALTVCCVVVLLSLGTAWLGRTMTDDDCLLALGASTAQCEAAPWDTSAQPPPARPLKGGWSVVWKLVGVAGGLIAVAGVAGVFVNVNRFSLHGMYRTRLVRAYLGASNTDRRPNPFSGFDPEDDVIRISDLRPRPGESARLLPILNATLNVVRGERLAWQERHAESFSMTPLFCGNFYQGYRDSRVYARPRGGMGLGSAMAISGAAANPNMGYVSTPALTFVMGLLNARLGVWLPNPGDPGTPVVSRPAPRHATVHLVREMLGLTDDYSKWVNVSDGGHFDNLGLYEVVLRRCRLVVVSDAGCDPRHSFGDLGSVIRKIRVDFGIPIEFESEILIPARGKEGETGPGLLCALGSIKYSAVDGSGVSDGQLIYLKPTLAPRPTGTVPYDVQAYAHLSQTFPHESTADQWFSESQFESYRTLGDDIVRTLLGGDKVKGRGDLLRCVQDHLSKGEPKPPPVASGPGLEAPRDRDA